MIASIVFMQGDDGREVVDRLECPTAETIREAVEYLSQWDVDTCHDIREESSAGSGDRQAVVGEYTLTWSLGLGYVGLKRAAYPDEIREVGDKC